MVWQPRIRQQQEAINMLGAGKDRGRRWGYKGPEAAKLELQLLGGRQNPGEAPQWEPKPHREGLSDRRCSN